MSERGIQIEENVFCPVCECYMSQEIMCNRKNAETHGPLPLYVKKNFGYNQSR